MKKMNLIVLLLVLGFGNAFSQAKLVNATVSLVGNVFNSVSKSPETVSLILMDNAGTVITRARSNASENGSYYMTGLKPGNTYQLRLKKKGYMEEAWKLDIPASGQYSELSHDFLISPLEANAMIPISVPPFELNKSKLRFGAEVSLEDLKNTLAIKENENVKIQIVCYADNNKSKADNKRLTEERAKAIMQYFVSVGINTARITSEGSDSTDPKNPPKSEKESKGKRYVGLSYLKIVSF